MYALPGLKLGWMALSGEEVRVGRALAALEMISDTFLPVSEIAQAAVPDIMSLGGPFLEKYSAEKSAAGGPKQPAYSAPAPISRSCRHGAGSTSP